MKELVHHREYSIRTYDLGDQRILVEGSLIDHRYRSKHHEPRETPRLVHDMIVRLQIKGPEMRIDKAEAAMPHHPREECTVVLPWIRNLEGLKITTGFTLKVKEIIGDTKGCAHLTSLVIAMGPCAVQGYWAAYGVDSAKRSPREDAIKKIINTCYVWRGDGPLTRKIRESLESSE
jgi:hypothetical protein